jgi:hypothetical protein
VQKCGQYIVGVIGENTMRRIKVLMHYSFGHKKVYLMIQKKYAWESLSPGIRAEHTC